MARNLTEDAAHRLRQASAALKRAADGAIDAQPSITRHQDDDLANAVFAEIAAAENLIRRAMKPTSN